MTNDKAMVMMAIVERTLAALRMLIKASPMPRATRQIAVLMLMRIVAAVPSRASESGDRRLAKKCRCCQ